MADDKSEEAREEVLNDFQFGDGGGKPYPIYYYYLPRDLEEASEAKGDDTESSE